MSATWACIPDCIGDILFQTLAMDGLFAVIAITVVAGVVYGFAGFGAALVFMPVATRFIPVDMAVAAFSVSALASFVAVVPRAWAEADQRSVTWMTVVAALCLPVGLWILRSNDVTTMRWAVLAVTCVTLVALMAGWRYTTQPSPLARGGVAAATGLVGGATGLVGPIMVLFQLSGQDSVARSRANTLVFLTMTGLLTAPLMAMQGMLSVQAVVLGLLLIVPYGLAARLGQRLFDPARQALYRSIAYGIIGASILISLPLWS